MKPRTERHIYEVTSLGLVVILSCGFVLAYGAAAAGLLGLIDSWRVSALTLSGAAISFLAIVGYFLLGTARLTRFDNVNNSSRASRNN